MGDPHGVTNFSCECLKVESLRKQGVKEGMRMQLMLVLSQLWMEGYLVANSIFLFKPMESNRIGLNGMTHQTVYYGCVQFYVISATTVRFVYWFSNKLNRLEIIAMNS